jgi:cytochrome c oxidase cbb3-type subunit 3
MWWKSLMLVSLFMITSGGMFLIRRERNFSTSPASSAMEAKGISQSSLFPGEIPPEHKAISKPRPERLSAYDVSQGKRYFIWFNCHGCHSLGGGAIGPALMDDKWIYGARPEDIFKTIVEGRKNGMPSYRGKIPEHQVWQLVAYIRSMTGQVPIDDRPGRLDDIHLKKPETLAPKLPPEEKQNPIDNQPGPGAR